MLFAALIVLGLCYLVAFYVFVTRSVDFTITRRMKAIPANAFAMDSMIAVGQSQPGNQLLVTGWHGPEAWGAWSSGKKTTLLVPPCIGGRRAKAVRLSIGAIASSLQQDGLVLSWPGQRNSVTIESGSISGASALIAADIPAGACTADTLPMVLRIDSARPASPKELGQGGDTRRLGFGLSGMEILSQPAKGQ